jgi:hypothetical protein
MRRSRLKQEPVQRYSGVQKNVFERLEWWIRCKLRCTVWRQWKRSYTRAKDLVSRGLSEETAWRSATNGRGPWWNAGAQHMNLAFSKSSFDRMGLVSLLDSVVLLCEIKGLVLGILEKTGESGHNKVASSSPRYHGPKYTRGVKSTYCKEKNPRTENPPCLRFYSLLPC